MASVGARGSTAEVDYLIERHQHVIPVEVKEGAQGGMKSLHRFMEEKGPPRGIKVSRYGFSDDGTIVTIPHYAIERLMSWQP